MLESLLQSIGINKAAAIAGLLGSIVSLKLIDGLGWTGRIFTIACGGLLANYGTPLLLFYYQMDPRHEAAIGFFVGLFGMSIVAAVMKSIVGTDLWTLIQRKFGGGS